MARTGIRIRKVEAGSPGARAGLSSGDEILAVNSHPIPDELALRFHLSEESVEMDIRKPDGEEIRLDLDLADGETLGIEVEDFRTRTCNNACLFCFIDQLPEGIRPALKVKDDDYRLSFLHGNYITLTNLPERELDRIIDQRLSPLYISVHATDPERRTYVLGRRKPDDLDRKMRKLMDGGIVLHTQIVLMPEINDGVYLDKSLQDLFELHPGVDSVAIVPLGLSDHGSPKEVFTPVTPEYCRKIISQLKPWQSSFRSKTGRTFAYLADEFYIQGGEELPPADYYDEYAQIEDGVGMVRKFLEDFDVELRRWRRRRPRLRGTLVTAKLFYPYLAECISRFNSKFESKLEVRMVENRFLGKNITVAGLLGGRDILAAIDAGTAGDFVILPHECVSRVDGILVDNLTPADLAQKLGLPVYASGRAMRDFFRLLCDELS